MVQLLFVVVFARLIGDAQGSWASQTCLASEDDRLKWTEISFDFGRLACTAAKNLENEKFSSSKYTTNLEILEVPFDVIGLCWARCGTTHHKQNTTSCACHWSQSQMLRVRRYGSVNDIKPHPWCLPESHPSHLGYSGNWMYLVSNNSGYSSCLHFIWIPPQQRSLQVSSAVVPCLEDKKDILLNCGYIFLFQTY